uniref:Uncharacterized protein n=1 Tax=Anguilla anguilla TaxID=7936 RepID=A0A0E9SYZ6_ANGAN
MYNQTSSWPRIRRNINMLIAHLHKYNT